MDMIEDDIGKNYGAIMSHIKMMKMSQMFFKK